MSEISSNNPGKPGPSGPENQNGKAPHPADRPTPPDVRRAEALKYARQLSVVGDLPPEEKIKLLQKLESDKEKGK